MGKFLKIIIFLAVFTLISFLPVIPVFSAPVIPNPVYTLKFIPLLFILELFVLPIVGVSYRMEWYSLAVIVILLAASFILTRYIAKRLQKTKVKS